MDSYYHNQANLPHFSGHYRQRGIDFGALALGIRWHFRWLIKL